jgi:hypothetical protein
MTRRPSTRRSTWPEAAPLASRADLLRRHPGELEFGPVQPAPSGRFDAGRAAEPAAVHRQMLEAGYQSDRQRHGRPDHWAVDATGDCEDKALSCHRRLAAIGWPKSAMRLWLCLPRQAGRWQGHAVLVVAITLNHDAVVDVALDCLRATPTRKIDLGYRLWRVVDPARTAALAPAAPVPVGRQAQAPPEPRELIRFPSLGVPLLRYSQPAPRPKWPRGFFFGDPQCPRIPCVPIATTTSTALLNAFGECWSKRKQPRASGAARCRGHQIHPISRSIRKAGLPIPLSRAFSSIRCMERRRKKSHSATRGRPHSWPRHGRCRARHLFPFHYLRL